MSKRTTLIAAAIVLAVNSLTVIVPFVSPMEVHAVNPKGCETEFSASYQKCVRTIDELKDAIANTTISQVILDDTIETTAPIVVSRPLLINGHDEKIVFVGDTDGWQGNFVLKAYNTTGVRLNSLQLEGGDAGLQINSSEVTLSGNARFANHEFGNISLAKAGDSATAAAPKLNISTAATIAGDTSTTTKPFAWVDTVATNDAVVSSFLHRGLNRSTVAANSGQHWYYANPDFTGTVATILGTDDVFATPQEAVDAATAGQTVQLTASAELSKALTINKAITFDGNGHTLTATYSHTGLSSDNGKYNTVLVVSSDNVEVKNLTTTNTATGIKPHGIVVDKKNNIKLTNVTLKNGRAGAIITSSKVTATNLTTVGNSWYGANIVGANTELTIDGVSSHDSNVYALYGEVAANVTVKDLANQYARIGNPVDGKNLTTDVAYVLRSAAPVADVKVNNQDANVVASDKTDPISVRGIATGDNAPKSHYFMIKGTGITGEYPHIIRTTSSDVSFNLRDAHDATNGVPLDSKGRVKEGTYTIRYVIFDQNNIRNDAAMKSETVTVTVDNTAPVVNASLSSNTVVSNDMLPSLTVSPTDNLAIDYTQYRIQTSDGNNIPGYGWVTIPNSSTTVLSEVAVLADGTYRVNARTFDTAGNKKNQLLNLTVDRQITSSVYVSSLSSLTPEIYGLAKYSDGSVIANTELRITVDKASFKTTTDASGEWSIRPVVAGSEEGVKHEVTVALASGVVTVPFEFTTTLDAVTIEEELLVTPAEAVAVSFPSAINPSSFAETLDDAISNAAPQAEKGQVEGAETVAQSAKADDANTGKALGLAWYWWLLAVAGALLIIWWIVAAVRNRRAEG